MQIRQDIKEKIRLLSEEYSECVRFLSKSGVSAQDYKEYSVRVSELEEIVRHGRELEEVSKKISELEDILETEDDLKDMALQEISVLRKEQEYSEAKIVEYFSPEDVNNKKNAIVEIRAGVGGDEASLFARDMYRMYFRFCEKAGYVVDVLNNNLTEMGGFKEIVFLVKGKGPYGDFRYESGVHRVQRVPETESHGRIHTSAITVAVFPEAEDKEVKIDPKDLRIETYRASGAGGQHVNKTDSAVRITHIPTGLVVACQVERSQLQNRVRALKILKARIIDLYETEKKREMDSERKGQVKGGGRSEKIRTYNFPQNRLTDHRIELTLHNLTRIMEGDISELIVSLREGLK